MDETVKNSLLIVDDEKSNIMVLTRILSSEYTIYAAKNGPDALEVANEYLPDIILLDIIMPGMNGYEVITILKSSDKTKEIPVIFVTGLNDAENEEKGLLLGAADYIHKPFRAVTVQLRVRCQIQMLNYIHTIKQLSMTDQLTNLPNRRNFDERVRLEWDRAIRNRAPISVLIIDLDNFKSYNDTYGHQQGDMALQAVAKIFIQELKRSIDYIARWGGEEFVVLLMNTDGDEAAGIAERLRISTENSSVPLADGQVTNITISIGVNTLTPAPDSSLGDFIRHADEALYTAKRRGRNRVCQKECTL